MITLHRLLFLKRGYTFDDYPSAMAIANKARELGCTGIRGKRRGSKGIDGQLMATAPAEAVEPLRQLAESGGWEMSHEGTVKMC